MSVSLDLALGGCCSAAVAWLSSGWRIYKIAFVRVHVCVPLPGDQRWMPLQSVLPAIHAGFSRLSPEPALLIKAATASGKSKLLPSELAQQPAGRVLVLAPSTIDVADMYTKATVSSS